MPDGSVILTEIRNGRCSRVTPDGKVSVFSECGGGPNGLAIGPDGALYLCNNGGSRYVEGTSMGQGAARRLQGRLGPAARCQDRRGQDALHRVRRPQALGAQRPGVRQAGRLLLHRSRQALRPPSRPWRRLLRAARRLEDHLHRLSDPQPQRLRAVARRQDALRRRHRGRRAVGVRHRGPGRAAEADAVRPSQRPGARRRHRAGALRQHGGAGERQYLRGDAHHRQDHRVLAGRRRRARGQDAGRLSDQHLLRWQ